MTVSVIVMVAGDAKKVVEAVGVIPYWLDEDNLEPAAVQLGTNYMHGGGWRPFCTSESVGKFVFDPKTKSLKYPGDPKHIPLARMKLRGETIYVYDSAWVLIEQANGRWEVCRMD